MNSDFYSIKKGAEILRLIFYISLPALAVAGNALFDEHSRKIVFFGLLALFTLGVSGGAYVKMRESKGIKKLVLIFAGAITMLASIALFSVTTVGIFT